MFVTVDAGATIPGRYVVGVYEDTVLTEDLTFKFIMEQEEYVYRPPLERVTVHEKVCLILKRADWSSLDTHGLVPHGDPFTQNWVTMMAYWYSTSPNSLEAACELFVGR